MDLSHHRKYHLQLKTKEEVGGEGSQLWQVTGKITVSQGKVVRQIEVITIYIGNSF